MLLRGIFFFTGKLDSFRMFRLFQGCSFFFLISDFELQSDLPIADRHPQTDGIERGG